MTPDDLEPLDRLLAERACERLIIDFVRRLDLGEPGSVAEQFATYIPAAGNSDRQVVADIASIASRG